jgi:hypothetical protein
MATGDPIGGGGGALVGGATVTVGMSRGMGRRRRSYSDMGAGGATTHCAGGAAGDSAVLCAVLCAMLCAIHSAEAVGATAGGCVGGGGGEAGFREDGFREDGCRVDGFREAGCRVDGCMTMASKLHSANFHRKCPDNVWPFVQCLIHPPSLFLNE